MVAMAIPGILYEEWFWLVMVLCLVAALTFVRRKYPPRSPSESKFFNRHKQTIRRATDLFIVVCVVLITCPVLLISVESISDAASLPRPVRAIGLNAYSAGLSIMFMFWSGAAGLMIGQLSTFQSNLTRRKRIVLLAICLLPVAFMLTALATIGAELRWSIILICVGVSWPSWLVNASAVLTGQHFFRRLWWIMCRLRLASGDYPDW
jgi:hypothetical protein